MCFNYTSSRLANAASKVCKMQLNLKKYLNSIRKQSRPGFSVIQDQIDHLTMFLMGTLTAELGRRRIDLLPMSYSLK